MPASTRGGRRRTVTLLPAADADIGRLVKDDKRLALRARALIGLVASGEVDGVELEMLPSYGDLTDCRKIYFGVTGDATTHRIVYQIVGQGRAAPIEIVEVVAVESRREGYAYLLTAQRLGRLPPETAPKLKRVHQEEITRRSSRRPPK